MSEGANVGSSRGGIAATEKGSSKGVDAGVTEEGSSEDGDSGRNVEAAAEETAAAFHLRLMSSGHERAEGHTCSICFLQFEIPFDQHSKINVCCMKRVCDGCVLAAQQRGILDNCPFCRTLLPEDDAPMLAMVQRRVEKGDTEAISHLGEVYFFGDLGLAKDASRAVELWTEAADLGSDDTHYQLGNVYYNGDGVVRDKPRAIRHWQQGAMKGDVLSRHSLGGAEFEERNYEPALRHWIISAKMGYKVSLDGIKNLFVKGPLQRPSTPRR